MPTPSNSGNPADDPATQPAAAPPSQGSTSTAGDPTTPPNPPAPQAFSGTWFREDDPQILIQWAVKQAQDPTSSSTPEPGSGSPTYKAQVRIYQMIFDTSFPNPPLRGFVVPFSVADPSVGTAPYLQGSFVLSQTTPPCLEVMNLRFPGFPAQNLTLYPSPPTRLGAGEPSAPAGPAAGGNAAASATSASGTAQPPAAGTDSEESPAA